MSLSGAWVFCFSWYVAVLNRGAAAVGVQQFPIDQSSKLQFHSFDAQLLGRCHRDGKCWVWWTAAGDVENYKSAALGSVASFCQV